MRATDKDAKYVGFYYAEKPKGGEERVRLKRFILALSEKNAIHAAHEWVRIWNQRVGLVPAEHRFISIVAEPNEEGK